MMPRYDAEGRLDDRRDAIRDLRHARDAQFDRYVGWIFSLAFVLLLIVVAVGAAAARWLWLACAA